MADFVLGRLKFVFKGVWATQTQYIKDDIVRYGGNAFVVKSNHTSNSDFYVDLTAGRLEKITAGTEFKGEWSATTHYKVDDIIIWGGQTFICNTSHVSTNNLYDNESDWTQYTSGFQWKGNYAQGVDYKVNDIVSYGASSYICTSQHTSASTLIDNLKWDVFAAGLEFEDSWNSGTAYQTGDVVTYGGYNYIAIQDNSNSTPYGNITDWKILTTGFSFKGFYNNVSNYSPGDLVRYGGHLYAARIDSTGNLPTSNTHWDVIITGFRWLDTWTDGTDYYPGDSVRQNSTSYVCKASHTAASGTSTEPALDSNGDYWDVIAEGDTNNILSVRGDLLTRNATQSARLPIGPEGTVLTSDGLDVIWGFQGDYDNTLTFYVAPHGVDDTAPGRGQSKDLPYASIKYACQQTANTAGFKTVFVGTGTYEEQLPILVPENTAIIGDEMRSVRVRPAAGNSDDGVTPNERSHMFKMNNATTIRHLTMSGLIGQLDGTPDASGYFRPTTGTGATATGVYVSLDPNGAITTQSPYVQNCTAIGTGAVGIKVDGSVQASGYKSILANDFTQIQSDGIGVWVLNGARSEIVSVFTYYAHTGYLADSGGTVRSLNGNCSYGEFGIVSSGVDANETPYSGTVNNRNQEAQVGGFIIGGQNTYNGGVHRIEFLHAGEHYNQGSIEQVGNPSANDALRVSGTYNGVAPLSTSGSGTNATFNIDIGSVGEVTNIVVVNQGIGYELNDTLTFAADAFGGNLAANPLTVTVTDLLTASISVDGSGSGETITLNAYDNAITYIDVVTNGENHYVTTGNAQSGSNTQIRLAASDNVATNGYNGMRVTIFDGLGVGQTAVINGYDATTKIATVEKDDGNPGWDLFGVRTVAEATLDPTTKYIIEPRVRVIGGGSPTRDAKLRAKVSSGKISQILIIDPGEGYSSTPSITITDPRATTLATATAKLGNGVLGATITAVGFNYTENTTTAEITGDGYADILPIGNSFVIQGLSQEPKEGASFRFQNDTTDYLVISVIGYLNGAGSIIVSPSITKAVAPEHGDTVTFREKFSNVRVTGHDFLSIGTGGFVDTNYPGASIQAADPDKEVVEYDRGRAFYTATDQDGNFRVGNLFRVQQSTGKATLNADIFDLSGLQELSLGGLSIGGVFSATINEFSTDGTLSGNSDDALVTERAIKTYVDSQLGSGENQLAVNQVRVGDILITGNDIKNISEDNIGTDINLEAKANSVINLNSPTRITETPTVDSDVANKLYVDARDTADLKLLQIINDEIIFDDVTLHNENAQTTDVTSNIDTMEYIAGQSTLEIDENGHLIVNVV